MVGTHSVASKVEDAKKHGLLQLTHCRLAQCPPELLKLPKALVKCTKLQVLDVSSTAIDALPCEYGRLENLKVLDIGATPLEKRWLKKKHLTRVSDDDGDDWVYGHDGEPNNSNNNNQGHLDSDPALKTPTQCQQIIKKLRRKDERSQLKLQLFEKLHDAPAGAQALPALRGAPQSHPQRREAVPSPKRRIHDVSHRQYRWVSAPEVLRDATRRERAQEARRGPRDQDPQPVLRPHRPHARGRHGALHLRARARAAGRQVSHQARRTAIPEGRQGLDGKQIQQQLVTLQQEITRERAAAVEKLVMAVKSVYSDTEPDQVLKLVTKVAALFKNTKELRSLTADVSLLLPVDFLNANPHEIRAAFLHMKAEALGTTSASHPTSSSSSKSTKATKHRGG